MNVSWLCVHIEVMVLVVSPRSIDATPDDDEGGGEVDFDADVDGMGWETRQQVSLSVR